MAKAVRSTTVSSNAPAGKAPALKKPAAPTTKKGSKTPAPKKAAVPKTEKPTPKASQKKASAAPPVKKVAPPAKAALKAVTKTAVKPTGKKVPTAIVPTQAASVRKEAPDTVAVKAAAPKKAIKKASTKNAVSQKVTAKSGAKKPAASPKKTAKSSPESLPVTVPKDLGTPMSPLQVKRVLITLPQPDGDKSPYFDLAKKQGLVIDFFPFISVEGLTGKEFRQQKIDFNQFTAVVFTSRLAVDHFFRIMDEVRIKVSQDLKYFCITEAVALYLQKFIMYRKRKVFFSADGSTQGLLDVIGKHKQEKYMVSTADGVKKELPAFLKKYKIVFTEASLYRTVANNISPAMAETRYDMILFFSPYSVQALFEQAPGYQQRDTVMGAFGPSTAKSVEEAGLRLDIKAPAPQMPGMVAALEHFFEGKK